MKKMIVLLTILVFVLTGCAVDEGAYNEQQITQQKEQIASLQKEISGLQSEKDKLQAENLQEKVDKGVAKYVLTLNISQTHFTLDLGQHLKDSMNEIELEIPVDKEFYDSVEIGTVLDDSFRVGSLLMSGSFGNWNIEVIDKEIR